MRLLDLCNKSVVEGEGIFLFNFFVKFLLIGNCGDAEEILAVDKDI